MGHFVYSFETTQPDVLIGMLSQFPFEAFEEHDTHIDGWLGEAENIEEVEEAIQSDLHAFFSSMNKRHVPDQNWNATWESRFEPVSVGSFCRIRALFHEPVAGHDHEIVIAPKQAFGTGHHETTYMMIDAMQNLGLAGKSVLDLGCGTGVLAILASKLGASPVVGIDIEEEAVENALENATLNGVEFEVKLGSVDVIGDASFDVVLANINRNAIMFLMDQISVSVKPGGQVLFSGFLEVNEREVREEASARGLEFEYKDQRQDWLCLGFRKSNH